MGLGRRGDVARSEPVLGPVLDFMRLLWAIDHGLQQASKRMAATLGVTGSQRLVIRIVSRFPGISAGTLAGILHVHPSTLTGVLERLGRRRLLRRGPDPGDARRSLLRLTAAGRRRDAEMEGTIEGAVQRVLRNLSAGELATARKVLGRVARELQEIPPSTGAGTRRARRDARPPA